MLNDKQNTQIIEAANCIKRGDVIAYPTEYCFGLGCDLSNKMAVEKILDLKSRNVSKGLIIIANNIDQLLPWIVATSAEIEKMQASWPASLTWLVRKSKFLPNWISGDSEKVAIRVANHKVARAIAQHSETAIVSTSCNPSGKPPAKNIEDVLRYFPNTLDYIVDSPVGEALAPSSIRDLITNEIIR